MILLCIKCGTKYVVSDALLTRKECMLKCTYCDYSWVHKKETNMEISKCHSYEKNFFLKNINTLFNKIKITKIFKNVINIFLILKKVIYNIQNNICLILKKIFCISIFNTGNKFLKSILTATLFLLFFVFILGLRNEYYDSFAKIYTTLGIFDVNNLLVENIEYQVFHDDSETDIMLSADIINKSAKKNIVPNMHILLMDKNGKILTKLFFKSNNRSIEPKNQYKFITKLNNVPIDLGRVIINIVDPIEFFFLQS